MSNRTLKREGLLNPVPKILHHRGQSDKKRRGEGVGIKQSHDVADGSGRKFELLAPSCLF